MMPAEFLVFEAQNVSWDPGVLLDEELSIQEHVNTLCSPAALDASAIHPNLSFDAAMNIVPSF